MTVYSVFYTKNRGIDLFDPVSKSTAAVPAAYCDDLKGCGGDTHNRGQYAFTANYRENCEIPLTGLQVSYSGFASRQITPCSLSGVSTTDAGVTLTASIAGLIVALGGLTSNSFGIGALKALLGIAAADAVYTEKVVGSQIILAKASTKRVVATLTRPIWELKQDQCGNDIGYYRASSLSLFGFDNSTCQAITLWQASIGAFLATAVYDAPDSSLGTTLLTDVTSFKLPQIALAVDSTVGCGAIQGLAEAQWSEMNTSGAVNFGKL